jgi:glutamyl-tRNA synthetase
MHVGSARTALYNWLFARKHRGTFVLRIEDTDEERNREEWVEGILSAMRWLGLDWDEGPYFQSAYAENHRAAAARLLTAGHAYYCDCTSEALAQRKKDSRTPGYDGFCADRGLSAGPGRALRFKVPEEGTTTVHDVVRGDVVFENSNIDDFVILKSNGQALFHLANAVDDMKMAISHVIRAEEHLPNTPKGLLLWDALGGEEHPVFAHLPVLVNEKRQKLSKRRDPVAVESYRDRGFLPNAMLNYLALLGWSPVDGRERLSLEEMIVEFRLEEVNNSPAFFDVVKMTHFNGEYIRDLSPAAFIEACRPWLEQSPPWPPERFDTQAFARMAPLVQERVATLDEVPAMVDFLFLDEPIVDPAAWEKAISRNDLAQAVLRGAIEALADCDWNPEAIRAAVAGAGEAVGLKLNKAQAPVRVAVTGRSVGPPLFESIEVLGRDATLARLRSAVDRRPAQA